MEWTYCLECGAPQFPGDAACPECASSSDPGDSGTTDAPAEPTLTWAGVLRSIWIAQLMAAAGGLLFALMIGFGLGYASRVVGRPAVVQRVEAAPSAPVELATASVEPSLAEPPVAEPRAAEPAPLEPGVVSPINVPATPATGSAEVVASRFVGPPRPFVGPPHEEIDDAWDLEGVRPPPEFWLNLTFRDRPHQSSRLPVYEPVSPPVQLYGRFLPGPTSVEIQWQIDTPQEWHGALTPALE